MQLGKQIQVDWLDHWFAPEIKIITFGEYISTITNLIKTGAIIYSVEIQRGHYKITYATHNHSDSQQR